MSRKVDCPMSAEALAVALGGKVHGDPTKIITSIASLEHANETDLAFFSDPKQRTRAASSRASVLIVRQSDVDINDSTKIIHAAPHAAFARALDVLFPAAAVVAGVSPLAQVDPTAVIAPTARVEAFATIGARVRIGAATTIKSHASVGADSVIGEHGFVHSGAHVYHGVTVGDHAIIHSGAIIGADGFGFQPSQAGWQKVAQVGGVIIGDDVEIGANTTIDRGAIEDTVIGNGVKIDNLVQIAHNCRVGDHTAIAACAGMAGSSVVGARCMIGGAAMIVGHISISDDVIISGGTLVSSSIDQPGRYTSVFPHTEHRTWLKIAANLRRSGK
jgi:UDP-3-O-[3-hydroxymyristoyl] glucosamine N-acyltransferase